MGPRWLGLVSARSGRAACGGDPQGPGDREAPRRRGLRMRCDFDDHAVPAAADGLRRDRHQRAGGRTLPRSRSRAARGESRGPLVDRPRGPCGPGHRPRWRRRSHGRGRPRRTIRRRRHAPGPLRREEVRRGLVVPVDASMVLDDLLPKATIWRTRVGDVYVAAELKRRGADFGGEPSGTWIFPKATLCPDGVYAAARLVTMVAARPLDSMVQEIPRYPVLRGSVAYDPSKRKAIESRLDAALRALGGHVSTVDGWRLQFDGGWSLVRFSRTEPKIRLTAESRGATRANEIYSAVLSSAKGATG